MPQLHTNPLTRDAFAAFGDVIQTEGARRFAINDGSAQRYDDLSRVAVSGDGAQPGLSIFVSDQVALPVTVLTLERHPLGSQAFVPLDGSEFLVVVAKSGPGGAAQPMGEPVAFVASGGQGVNYHPGVWHLPLTVLRGAGRFLVIDRIGPGENLEIASYRQPGWRLAKPCGQR